MYLKYGLLVFCILSFHTLFAQNATLKKPTPQTKTEKEAPKPANDKVERESPTINQSEPSSSNTIQLSKSQSAPASSENNDEAAIPKEEQKAQKIESLQSERQSLLTQGADTRAVEKELAHLGVLFNAEVEKTANTYKFQPPLTFPNSEAHWSRLTNQFSISDYEKQESDYVEVIFNASVTEEEITSFFKAIGFSGFNVK